MAKALSDDYTEIVILCEDRQQEVFIRRFLKKNGIKNRRVRVLPYPAGRGSGEQFVREQYQFEVEEHRRRAAKLNIALIVMQDCDERSVEAARARLEQTVNRHQNERIAILLPKRNIETWIRFLMDGGPVDESEHYPKLNRESECHDVVDRLGEKNEYRLTPNVPSSLRAACPEIRRILPAKRCVQSSQ